MPDINYQDFEPQFENTKYPFSDTATLTDIEGTFTIPESLLIDASLYLPGASKDLYISEIDIGLEFTRITISEENGSLTAQAVITSDLDTDVIPVTDGRGCMVGCLVSDSSRLSFLRSKDTGTYTFSPNGTRFAARCVFPDSGAGVSGIQSGDSVLFGDVWLIGGDGVYLTVEDNTIRVDIAGDPLYSLACCDTSSSEYKTPNYLRTINGLKPDMYGNFIIQPLFDSRNKAFRIVTTNMGTTFKEI